MNLSNRPLSKPSILNQFIGKNATDTGVYKDIHEDGEDIFDTEIDQKNEFPKMSIIYVTFPDHETAVNLCSAIIDNQLAKCANVFPEITSIYEWQGKSETAPEVVAIIKAKDENFEEIKDFILASHPYEIPCIIKLSIQDCEKNFAKWLAN